MMPDVRNDRTRARTTDVAHGQQHATRRTEEALAHAVQQAEAVRHPAEHRDLAAKHRMLDNLFEKRHTTAAAGVDRETDRAVLDVFERTQREQLAQRQKLELTVAAGLTASSDDLAAARRLSALRAHVDRVNRQMAEDLRAVAEAVGKELYGPDLRSALDEVVRDQIEALEQLHHATVLELGLEEARRVGEDAGRTLDHEQAAAVNARIGEELDVAPLDEAAVERIAAEGRSRRLLGELDEETRLRTWRAAVSRVKGQLFEELMTRAIEAELPSVNASRPAERQLRFIRGDQIRDEQGRKLTDGMLAWHDRTTGDLHIDKAFEAKAGHDAARELNRIIDKLTLDDKEETRRYARDLARDEVLGAQANHETVDQYAARQQQLLGELSEEKRRDLERLTNAHYERLISRRVQTELGGQIQRTIERLHESTDAATRIRVDGEEARLAINRGLTDVVKVVPVDVQTRDLNAVRLNHRARDLQVAAEAVVDELERRGII